MHILKLIKENTLNIIGQVNVMHIKSKFEINSEWDIIEVRQEVRKVCKKIGFDYVTQAYIINFTSGICQNMYTVAQSGLFSIEGIIEEKRMGIKIIAVDQGPGIENMADFLSENIAVNQTDGIRLEMLSVRRWFDEFEIASTELGVDGVEVTVTKWLIKG